MGLILFKKKKGFIVFLLLIVWLSLHLGDELKRWKLFNIAVASNLTQKLNYIDCLINFVAFNHGLILLILAACLQHRLMAGWKLQEYQRKDLDSWQDFLCLGCQIFWIFGSIALYVGSIVKNWHFSHTQISLTGVFFFPCRCQEVSQRGSLFVL